jgi:D-threo-aldose 1-dehydrogenase
MKSYEHSMQRLALDHIDILFMHDIGSFGQGDNNERAMKQALAGGGLRALEELRSSGIVPAPLASAVNEWQVLDELVEHARFDVFLLANRYTLLDQGTLDHFLPARPA